jgi:hypothetical protein
MLEIRLNNTHNTSFYITVNTHCFHDNDQPHNDLFLWYPSRCVNNYIIILRCPSAKSSNCCD